MRATLFLPLLALALISTAGAQSSENQSPLKCKECWSNSRAEIPECKNLSPGDLEELADLDDPAVAAIDENNPMKRCLCALPPRTPDILQSCDESCPPEMADALKKEANIVGSGVCISKSSLKSDEETDSSTSGEGGAKDEPETGDGSNSANSDSSSDDKKEPSAGGASSVQWSGALLTVVAVMASAVAF